MFVIVRTDRVVQCAALVTHVRPGIVSTQIDM